MKATNNNVVSITSDEHDEMGEVQYKLDQVINEMWELSRRRKDLESELMYIKHRGFTKKFDQLLRKVYGDDFRFTKEEVRELQIQIREVLLDRRNDEVKVTRTRVMREMFQVEGYCKPQDFARQYFNHRDITEDQHALLFSMMMVLSEEGKLKRRKNGYDYEFST